MSYLDGGSLPVDAPNSICPKGWRLPDNLDFSTGAISNKSYINLLPTYLQMDWVDIFGTGIPIPIASSDTELLANTAMSFVRLGTYNYDYGSLNGRGEAGRYWSSTALMTQAAFLDFGPINANPINTASRAGGNTIRCVSR